MASLWTVSAPSVPDKLLSCPPYPSLSSAPVSFTAYRCAARSPPKVSWFLIKAFHKSKTFLLMINISNQFHFTLCWFRAPCSVLSQHVACSWETCTCLLALVLLSLLFMCLCFQPGRQILSMASRNTITRILRESHHNHVFSQRNKPDSKKTNDSSVSCCPELNINTGIATWRVCIFQSDTD